MSARQVDRACAEYAKVHILFRVFPDDEKPGVNYGASEGLSLLPYDDQARYVERKDCIVKNVSDHDCVPQYLKGYRASSLHRSPNFLTRCITR